MTFTKEDVAVLLKSFAKLDLSHGILLLRIGTHHAHSGGSVKVSQIFGLRMSARVPLCNGDTLSDAVARVKHDTIAD